MRAFCKVRIELLVGLMALSVSGCAALMALHGEKEVEVTRLHVGQPRDEVLMIMGEPVETMLIPTGRTDVFEFERGNEPSAVRALGHATMDFLTLGGWELVGTPSEAANSLKLRVFVQYDKDNKVTKLKAEEIGEE